MDATPRTRPLGALLACLLPFLAAWRPYDTLDGPSTPQGQLAIEWGVMSLQLQQPQLSMSMPQLLARLGVARRVEIGARGSYQLGVSGGPDPAAPWERGAAAGNFGVYGKWEVIGGAPPRSDAPRPAIAVLSGVQFLTSDATWGLDLRAAGTLTIGPVVSHLNIGFLHNGYPAVVAGAVVSAPLSFGLTPAVEVSGEVRFGGRPSVVSVMASLVQALPGVPFAIDVAVRRGVTGGTPDWIILAGVTMQLRLWQPRL